MRRSYAKRIRDHHENTWPIQQSAGGIPKGWPGWPEGKKFAVVLSHDVEGRKGLGRCLQLMSLQKQMGFRACFNLIPEGTYSASEALRETLAVNGFEVGVHDLRHDGKLYRSERIFRRHAKQINNHLRDWKALGFRAGFMRHQLSWQHELEVRYDASTFDTDPFEPQPDGVDTIFPFWVTPRNNRGGYAELPYTLAQDYTLFVVLRAGNIETWKKKIDWIADLGGMVFVDTHPDYMSFEGKVGKNEYSVALYQELLRYIDTKYEGQFWQALPREVAEFTRSQRDKLPLAPTAHNENAVRSVENRNTIWIDLENTPHIPFFRPIIQELKNRGYSVVLTARDAFQTCEMAASYGFVFTKVGRHYGQNSVAKLWGLIVRSVQLIPFALRRNPVMGLNHGSRAQILVCNLLRIPTVMVMDYEHSSTLPMVRPSWEIVPAVVSDEGLHCKRRDRIRKFSGIKEDVYVPDFRPDAAIVERLQLRGKIIVTVRPPATEAHYHNPEADIFFLEFMELAFMTPNVKVILLPRNRSQKEKLTNDHPNWFEDSKVVIPDEVIDGLNLLWHSDLAVSGGGTMNREAAALGVPVYSLFRGKIGAVDRSLEAQGRLILIESTDDVRTKILLTRKLPNSTLGCKLHPALFDVVDHVDSILQTQQAVSRKSLQNAIN